MKVIFFIDGQNLFHSLKNLDKDLNDRDINWEKLFSSCLQKGEIIEKAYWIRPAIISEQQKFSIQSFGYIYVEEHYPSQSDELKEREYYPKDIFKEIKKEYDNRIRWWKNEKKNFHAIQRKYKNLVKEYQFMELHTTGVLKADLYNKKLVGEKGVDVGVAVKIVESALTGECDRVILLSGDSDYEEVVNVLKRNDKEIHCIGFGNAMSQRLKFLVNGVYDITLEDIKLKFKK